MKRTLLIALLAVTIASCGGGSSNDSDTSSRRALVEGEVQGRFYDRISQEVAAPTVYDGSQNVADYDLLIVDAQTRSTQELGSDELLIDEALAAGVPALILNPNDEQIRSGLIHHIGASIGGDALGYLVHNTGTETGRREKAVVTFPPIPPVTAVVIPDSVSRGSSDAEIAPASGASANDESIYDKYLDRLERFIDHRELLAATNDSGAIKAFRDASTAPQFTVDTPPSYADYQITSFHLPFNTTVQTQQNGAPSSAVEATSVVVQFYAFKDSFANDYKIFISQEGISYVDSSNNIVEALPIAPLRLFQQEFRCSTQALNSGAYTVDFSPKNINNATTYTDSTSTTVGVNLSEHPSASASYTVTHSVTRTIYDWSVENTSPNPSVTSWRYFQTDQGIGNYDDLPAISRENLSFSNTSLWSVPAGNQSAAFYITAGRTFGYTGLVKLYNALQFDPAPMEIKALLP